MLFLLLLPLDLSVSKVRFDSPDLTCPMNMGGYGPIPCFKRYVRGLCQMPEEIQAALNYFPLGSTTSVWRAWKHALHIAIRTGL